MRILLVEDNNELLENLVTLLESQNYQVSTAKTGQAGSQLALQETFDLIILDLNLPDIDGLKICKILRENNVSTPILMLTARIDLESKVSGLNYGADDYLTKPFASEELFARIKAILRRNSSLNNNKMNIQQFEINIDNQAIKNKKDNSTINISRTEFEIIKYLLFNRGKVCTTMDIYNSIWGDRADELMFSDTLKVHIARIRSKLTKDFIKTINGVGYIIE